MTSRFVLSMKPHLPPINTADRRRITELAADGPPEEDVGLDPFGMDPMMMDPALAGGRR